MIESTFTQLTASALAELYRRREASPVEVVEAVLARIAHLNPLLCAYATLDPEGARAAARASEVRWHAGTPASPIDGVPPGVAAFMPIGYPTLMSYPWHVCVRPGW